MMMETQSPFDCVVDASVGIKLFLADLKHLPLQRVPLATLAQAALKVALHYGSTAYDSAYVALAQQLELPFITADASLVQRFTGTGLDVQILK